MHWWIIGGCLIAVWAMLSIIGNEWQRQTLDLVTRSRVKPEPAAEEPIYVAEEVKSSNSR